MNLTAKFGTEERKYRRIVEKRLDEVRQKGLYARQEDSKEYQAEKKRNAKLQPWKQGAAMPPQFEGPNNYAHRALDKNSRKDRDQNLFSYMPSIQYSESDHNLRQNLREKKFATIFERKKGERQRVQDHTLESFDGRGVRRLERMQHPEDFRTSKVFAKSLSAQEIPVSNPIELMRLRKGMQ